MITDEFPYGGTSKSEDAKIERCVASVMKTGKDKVAAIKICKASIMKNDMFEFEPVDKEEFSKTLKGVEIFREGVYRGKKFTKKVIKEMVDNFKKLKEKGFKPPIRIGHRIDGRSDINARNLIGYVEHVYDEEDDDGVSHLYADSKIEDDEEGKKIGKTLINRSVEIGDYEDNDGNRFKNVLWGYGFVDIPQVENMKPITAEVQMFDKVFDTELYDIESMVSSKKDASTIKKAIEQVKKIIDSSISTEDYWKVQRAAEIISSLKGMIPYVEETMDKDEKKEEPKEEEVITANDKEEEKKDSEEVTLSKDEHIELMEAKKKIEEMNKVEMEKEIASREEKVKEFQNDGKVIAESYDKEVELAKSLTKEQFDIYCEVKSNQPKFIELDADKGKQESKEVETDEKTEEKEKMSAVEKANEMLANHLREAGWSEEQIKAHLEK